MVFTNGVLVNVSLTVNLFKEPPSQGIVNATVAADGGVEVAAPNWISDSADATLTYSFL